MENKSIYPLPGKQPYIRNVTVARKKTTCQDSNLSEMIHVFLWFLKKNPSSVGEENVILRGYELQARLNFSL